MMPEARPRSGENAFRVSANGRYLLDPRGKPFFWLGDTAWLLFQMPTRGDVELYLDARARQGFSVIQAALVMGEERVGGTLRPNAYGQTAFVDGDHTRPNEPYWQHADWVIEAAHARGLTLALLPNFIASRGDAYRYLTEGNALEYGRFLGRRYRGYDHLIWVLGGDNERQFPDKADVWHRVARGLATGVTGVEDYRRTVMTHHICAVNSSSKWFHDAPWLDFNMIQTWSDYEAIYRMVEADRLRRPPKPTVLAEAAYEDGPQYPTRPIDAHVIRKQAYWSYFAGGFHTYGNTNTWNFGTYQAESTQDWRSALNSPGARGMEVLRRVFDRLEWWRLVPDQSVFVEGPGSGRDLNAALRTEAGDCALVYLASAGRISLAMDRLIGGSARATWIDPRSGGRQPIGRVAPTGARSFDAPAGWQDALLEFVRE